MYSKLVSYVQLSPNCNPRKNAAYNPTGHILKITLHHQAGTGGVEAMGALFAQPGGDSANYGIGSDGRIACYVEEEYRAWTSGSQDNDYLAITIEVANNGGAPNWPISDAAYKALIELCADICTRHGFSLNFTGDASGSLTMHRYFANTLCPGPYLANLFPNIAHEVNGRLSIENTEPADQPEAYKPTVKEWQQAAMADGFAFPLYGADGIWGEECEGVARKAVVCVRGDGYYYPNLTKLVQRVCGLTGGDADGLCGPMTAEAIRAYQTGNGLQPVDGAAGIQFYKHALGV